MGGFYENCGIVNCLGETHATQFFSDLEYASKKRVTRRDRFLGEIEQVTPWAALVAEIGPFYPKGEGRLQPCGKTRPWRIWPSNTRCISRRLPNGSASCRRRPLMFSVVLVKTVRWQRISSPCTPRLTSRHSR